MRLVSVLICDLQGESDRERQLKSLLMSNWRTPWIASVDYRDAEMVQMRFHPYLVLLDLEPDPERGLDVIPLISQKMPPPYILVTGLNIKDQFSLRALELGVTEFLPGKALHAELEQAVEKIAVARTRADTSC